MRIKIPKQNHQELSRAKARIIAHLIGDGAVYKTNHDYVIKYEVKDNQSLHSFYNDMIEVYGLNLHIVPNKSGKCDNWLNSVRLRSKIVFEDLHRYTGSFYSSKWLLKPLILNTSLSLKKEFLSALYDDEGSISSKYCLILYSINKKGLSQIRGLLKEFKIQSEIKPGFGCRRNVYGLITKNLKAFYRKINFNLDRKKDKLKLLIKNPPSQKVAKH